MKNILLFLVLCFALMPIFSQDNFSEGLENVKKVLWNEAKINFEKQTLEKPTDFSAFYNLALVNLKLGQHVEVIYNMEKSLKLNPKNNAARNHIVKSRTALDLSPEYVESASIFKIKMMSFSLNSWRFVSIVASLLLASLIFLWFKKKTTLLLLLNGIFFLVLLFSLYFTNEKQNFAITLSHGILSQKIESAFVSNEGNARTNLIIMQGEKVRIFEENANSNRIGIYVNEESIVWIPKEQIKLF